MKTPAATQKTVERKWHVVDASGLILGRMSAIIASYLRGKHKTYFTPNVDCGDYVIVVNADKVALTGNKKYERFYWYTGYMGGVKFRTKAQMLEEHPDRLVENSVRRMISRGPLGRAVMKKLFVYSGDEHPHEAQKPEVLDIKSKNVKNFKK
ncbi:MAG: 50S ribosomal protein L13 [Rickettsiales bacterium]|jgi:large subunit ribosomal protein L13|nr:50S ribosomal protein L13 [Rickettsiales bacterium]